MISFDRVEYPGGEIIKLPLAYLYDGEGEIEMKTKKALLIKDVTLTVVETSTFGCINCLWNSAECIAGSKFVPALYMGKPTCKGYNYYD